MERKKYAAEQMELVIRDDRGRQIWRDKGRPEKVLGNLDAKFSYGRKANLKGFAKLTDSIENIGEKLDKLL